MPKLETPTVRTNVSLPAPLFEQLVELARKGERPVSREVRIAIRRHLEHAREAEASD